MRMEDSNPSSILHLYSSTFHTLLLFHSSNQHSEYVTFHQQKKRMTSYIIAPPSPSECFLSRELLLQHQRSFPLAEVFRPVLSIGQIIRVAMLRKARLGTMPTHRIGSCFNFFFLILMFSSWFLCLSLLFSTSTKRLQDCWASVAAVLADQIHRQQISMVFHYSLLIMLLCIAFLLSQPSMVLQ